MLHSTKEERVADRELKRNSKNQYFKMCGSLAALVPRTFGCPTVGIRLVLSNVTVFCLLLSREQSHLWKNKKKGEKGSGNIIFPTLAPVFC